MKLFSDPHLADVVVDKDPIKVFGEYIEEVIHRVFGDDWQACRDRVESPYRGDHIKESFSVACVIGILVVDILEAPHEKDGADRDSAIIVENSGFSEVSEE